MSTPSIQTLRNDAQQVLNLDSISAVRSVVAATLANANAGTPLNPNLTTQQLWNEFYQIATQPKSDIESIIANQLMKFAFSPPAPGGSSANQQVIFNDAGVLAGDPDFLWNKTTNLLTVAGSATITGDLTVDTSTLKVDSANNRVGIGTTSPTVPLDVVGSGDGELRLRAGSDTSLILSETTANKNWKIKPSSGDLYFQYSATGYNTGYSSLMSLTTSGNLGLGVTPSAWGGSYKAFQIANTSRSLAATGAGSGDLTLAFNAVYDATDSRWEYTATGDKAGRYSQTGAGDHVWYNTNTAGTAGNPIAFTQAMTLDASGRLGIGTVSPGEPLTVIGGGPTSSTVNFSGGVGGFDNATIASDNDLVFQVDANNNVGNRSFGWRYGGKGYSDGTFLMKLDSSGNLLVGVTSANANGGVLQLKSGITFPATQVASTDANTLDDYEEGTWTPVVADAASGGNTGTCTVSSAKYVKIGRLVSVQCDIRAVNTTGMTAGNTFFIRNFPFTAQQGGNGNFYTYRVGRNAATVSSSAFVPDNASSVVFFLYSTNSATTDNTILVSNIVSGTSEIILSVTYFV